MAINNVLLYESNDSVTLTKSMRDSTIENNRKIARNEYKID